MLKQQFHLALGNGSSGLIHNDDLCVNRDGLDDLDKLALRHREISQRLLGRYVQAALLNQLLRFFDFRLFVHQAIFANLASHKNVLINSHVQDRV